MQLPESRQRKEVPKTHEKANEVERSQNLAPRTTVEGLRPQKTQRVCFQNQVHGATYALLHPCSYRSVVMMILQDHVANAPSYMGAMGMIL